MGHLFQKLMTKEMVKHISEKDAIIYFLLLVELYSPLSETRMRTLCKGFLPSISTLFDYDAGDNFEVRATI